jgi:hypothetical protein
MSVFLQHPSSGRTWGQVKHRAGRSMIERVVRRFSFGIFYKLTV